MSLSSFVIFYPFLKELRQPHLQHLHSFSFPLGLTSRLQVKVCIRSVCPFLPVPWLRLSATCPALLQTLPLAWSCLSVPGLSQCLNAPTSDTVHFGRGREGMGPVQKGSSEG